MGQVVRLRDYSQQPKKRGSTKQRIARIYGGYTYYLGGALSVLHKIERDFEGVDASQAEAALLKLKRQLRRAWLQRRPK